MSDFPDPYSRKHLSTPDETIRRAAEIWTENEGRLTQSAHQMDTSTSTFGRYIRMARERGFLPPLRAPNGPEKGGPVFMAQRGYAPANDLTHELPEGLTLKGTSIRYDGDGTVQQYWNKSRLAGLEPEDSVVLPDPKKITKTSTLYDQQGRVTQQWVSEKQEDKDREALWLEFAKALAEDLPRAQPIPANDHLASDQLAACYPVGDHHFGMRSWSEETGADYDLNIAERLLTQATDYLLAATPACEQAFIAFLGDLNHYDSFEAVTPTHRNLLDADGRFPKMVRVAIRSIRYMIEAALRRHKHVTVIIEIGNHDMASSVFLMECLANIYENEPRVTIDRSPSHYHYFTFGKCLVGTHHGHGSKMEKLPLIMAADRPAEWGAALHRYWWTGHIHSRTAHDFNGCTVESFRILPPADAYAAQKGYRSIRDMKAIVLHKEFGEVARHTVNPQMIDGAIAA